MSEFNVNPNAGGSFTLDDDDEDLASMFDKASAASEDSGDFDGLSDSEKWSESKPQKRQEPSKSFAEENELDRAISELENSDTLDEVSQIDETPEPVREPLVEETPEPDLTPEPIPEPEPVVATPAPAPAAAPRVRVKKEAEQVDEARQVIAILDVYRSLSSDEKSVAIQFVTNGEMDSAEDHVVVVKVINSDPLLAKTMKALQEAYEHEAVERAFFTLGLEQKVLHALGNLVSVFSNEDYDTSTSNLDYSRQVVSGIAALSDREISFVKATGSLLLAAELD